MGIVDWAVADFGELRLTHGLNEDQLGKPGTMDTRINTEDAGIHWR